jgi:hypothetical protein
VHDCQLCCSCLAPLVYCSVPVANALRTKEDRVIQVHVSHGAVSERLPSVKDERDVDSELLLSLFKLEQRLDVVDQRLQCVLGSDEVEASNQVRELLLEREAIFQVPFELLRRHEADRAVDNLRVECQQCLGQSAGRTDACSEEFIFAAQSLEVGFHFVYNAIEGDEPIAMRDCLAPVRAVHEP